MASDSLFPGLRLKEKISGNLSKKNTRKEAKKDIFRILSGPPSG
ncbi:hypothetical protein ASZ90_014222 [hydrocarbon metagenome]|jgi:hypothetical protein|uniref:Uncharacterized protein n=1 Tax=hydrocarbon metagenome TaxID=938273 RepID=A0A0W8F5L4_9ZZZZ